MIVDQLKNHRIYHQLGARIARGLNYLDQEKDRFSDMQSGRYPIDGDAVFALVNRYDTKNVAEGIYEAHREYVDLQYVVFGSELIGYAPLNNQPVIQHYSVENDYALYQADGSCLRMDAGMFAVFFPEDLHMPGVDRVVTAVCKVVVKVKL